MKIFVDACFYISLLRKDDTNHSKAIDFLNNLNKAQVSLYTSYFIIDETATVLSMRVTKQEADLFLETTQQEDFPIILDFDHIARAKSYKLFSSVQNKNISMVDCHSAILMKNNAIKHCLTFDKHFKKLGFKTYNDILKELT